MLHRVSDRHHYIVIFSVLFPPMFLCPAYSTAEFLYSIYDVFDTYINKLAPLRTL